MEKIRVEEVVIVEGRYDAGVLAGVVDGLILTTDGFSIFSDEEKKALIRRLGAQRGLLILTDSDAAGFRIRHYLEKIAQGCRVVNAYVPALRGKERRKHAPGREGLLGVEGFSPEALRAALQKAGVAAQAATAAKSEVTPADLYAWGLAGTAGSAQRRRSMLSALGLPPRLSTRALCGALGSLYTRGELEAAARQAAEPKPVLFWDFHGTLTHHDLNWYDAAMEAAAEKAPERALEYEVMKRHLGGACLPWFTVESRDTRHLVGSAAWWGYCEGQFREMFQKCGFDAQQAARIAPAMRAKILQPYRYHLHADAKDTLSELTRRGYQSHILSNNFPELEDIVAALGMRTYFGEVIASGGLGYEKPHAGIYDYAKKLAGDGPAPIMIGDNPRDDIEGAKAAGFRTIAVHGADAPGADHTVDALGEILALLP